MDLWIVEGIRFLFQLAFSESKKAGMSPEQIVALYEEEKKKFEQNDPSKIPTV